jgi:hypothetical protein
MGVSNVNLPAADTSEPPSPALRVAPSAEGEPPSPTTTLVGAVKVPLGPVQVIKYVVVADGETVIDPFVPGGEKLVPEHDDALIEDHVRVVDSPGLMFHGPFT